MVYLVPLLPLPVIVIIFLSDPPLEKGFLLRSHDSFHALSTLLELEFTMPYLLFVKLF